jgi:ABC-type glycerol-3-phosphate transport system substrate-binding protein
VNGAFDAPWSRRDLLRRGAGLGLLGLGSLAAGCSAPRSERALPASTGSPPVNAIGYDSADIDWQAAKGTNLVFRGSDHQWVAAITALRPAFTELTGIDLRMEVGGETELGKELPALLAAGAPSPDVFMVPSYGSAVAAGWLEPLDAYLEDPARTDAAWYRLDDVYPSSMDFVRWRGGIYGLPITRRRRPRSTART